MSVFPHQRLSHKEVLQQLAPALKQLAVELQAIYKFDIDLSITHNSITQGLWPDEHHFNSTHISISFFKPSIELFGPYQNEKYEVYEQSFEKRQSELAGDNAEVLGILSKSTLQAFEPLGHITFYYGFRHYLMAMQLTTIELLNKSQKIPHNWVSLLPPELIQDIILSDTKLLSQLPYTAIDWMKFKRVVLDIDHQDLKILQKFFAFLKLANRDLMVWCVHKYTHRHDTNQATFNPILYHWQKYPQWDLCVNCLEKMNNYKN